MKASPNFNLTSWLQFPGEPLSPCPDPSMPILFPSPRLSAGIIPAHVHWEV
jgi:hypothetical protein